MTKAVGLIEKGLIIATREGRIAEWLSGYIKACVEGLYALKYAATRGEFNTLIEMPEMVMAFIETDFFEDETICELDYLRKMFPNTQIILFSVCDVPPEDMGRYLWWGADSFISLRNVPNLIHEQIKAIVRGLNNVPAEALDGIREYNRLSVRPPYFTPREIEIIRCIAREKTIKETAVVLAMSEHTVNNYLYKLYRKCGVNNMVGLVKAGLSAGIIMVKDLIILFKTDDWEG